MCLVGIELSIRKKHSASRCSRKRYDFASLVILARRYYSLFRFAEQQKYDGLLFRFLFLLGCVLRLKGRGLLIRELQCVPLVFIDCFFSFTLFLLYVCMSASFIAMRTGESKEVLQYKCPGRQMERQCGRWYSACLREMGYTRWLWMD